MKYRWKSIGMALRKEFFDWDGGGSTCINNLIDIE